MKTATWRYHKQHCAAAVLVASTLVLTTAASHADDAQLQCAAPLDLAQWRSDLRVMQGDVLQDFTADQRLDALREELECADRPIPRELLSELFFLMGLAECLALPPNEAAARQGFWSSLEMDSEKEYDDVAFGIACLDQWQSARASWGKVPPTEVLAPTDGLVGRLWLDGRRVEDDDLPAAMTAGYHLQQQMVDGHWQGRWFLIPQGVSNYTLSNVIKAPEAVITPTPPPPPASARLEPALAVSSWWGGCGYTGVAARGRIFDASDRFYGGLGIGAGWGPIGPDGICSTQRGDDGALDGVWLTLPIEVAGGYRWHGPGANLDIGLSYKAIPGANEIEGRGLGLAHGPATTASIMLGEGPLRFELGGELGWMLGYEESRGLSGVFGVGMVWVGE